MENPSAINYHFMNIMMRNIIEINPMKKIFSILDNALYILSSYIDKINELLFVPMEYDPCGAIAYQKRFSYEDRIKISKAVDELKQNPSIKSYTLSLEKETITIRLN